MLKSVVALCLLAVLPRASLVGAAPQEPAAPGTPDSTVAQQQPAKTAAEEAPQAPSLEFDLPIKISEDGRYFVDQKGRPFFWLGTTQWELFRRYTLDEAKLILDRTRAHGFTVVQVMLPGVGDGKGPNLNGEKPWLNDDPLTPNEAYFKHVDAVLRMAADDGLVVSMTTYHQRYRQSITQEKARPWAKWLAARYKDSPNLIFTMHPKAEKEYVPVIREMAAGLKEGDGGRHLIGCKPDPAPFSSSFVHTEDWLKYNTIQTWKDVKLIYPMVTTDYGLKPVKPVVMGEGAYESGSEYGFDVTPLWVRRQAYYSYLAGGYHSYGHNDSWRVLPTWKAALDAPGAVQMGILKKALTDREEWWRLVPDQTILAEGGQIEGDILHLSARHQAGKWALVYLADPTTFSVDASKVKAAKIQATWLNPKTGDSRAAETFAPAGAKSFSTPIGWEDALLVLVEAGRAGPAEAK